MGGAVSPSTAGLRAAVGPSDERTIDVVLGFAATLADQGKLGEAEPLYRRALQGFEQLCSDKGTVNAVQGLAITLAKQVKLGDRLSRCFVEHCRGMSSIIVRRMSARSLCCRGLRPRWQIRVSMARPSRCIAEHFRASSCCTAPQISARSMWC